MQDDVYLIAVNGWKVEINILKNKKGKEAGWDCDLIPKDIAIHKYFAKEQEVTEKLQSELENVDQQMQTLDEENSGEDDFFAEARTEAGKINKGNVSKRIKEIRGDKDFVEELKVLQEYIALTEKESELNGKLDEAEELLDKKLLVKYKNLTEEEIKTLVVEDKWMTALHTAIKSEMDNISQKLTGRIKELAERYQTPLPALTHEVESTARKVDSHLKNMCFKW